MLSFNSNYTIFYFNKTYTSRRSGPGKRTRGGERRHEGEGVRRTGDRERRDGRYL